MAFDPTKFAQTVAATSTEPRPRVRASHVQFLTELAMAGVRLSYGAAHTLVYGSITKGSPTYKPLLQALPIDLQWVMCRKSGTYDPEAIAAWGHLAPKGINDMPVIQAEAIQAAYAAWIAPPRIQVVVPALPEVPDLDLKV